MTLPSPDSDLARGAHQLETRAAYRAWAHTGVVRVRGDDRVTWLNGQITNDVRAIADGESVHALAVNIKGKILAELWVSEFRDLEEFRMLVPERAQAALLESLEHFIIMEDVTVERLPELHVLSVEGPLASALRGELAAIGCRSFACDPLGIGGVAYLGTTDELGAITQQLEARHVPRITPEAYELVRLRRARPRYGVDFDEHQYPQEAGLKAYVSFNKGCYLGQEVVCTLESRGRLSRHLCALRGAQGALIEPGTPLGFLNAGGSIEQSGAITSAAWDPELGASLALGYVRRVHARPESQLTAGTQALTLIKLVGDDEAATDARTDAPASSP